MRVMAFERQGDGAQAEKRFPRPEKEDGAQKRERPRERKPERGARGGEQKAAVEDEDEEQVRDEDDAPEVGRVDARDFYLSRRELEEAARRHVGERGREGVGDEAHGESFALQHARQSEVVRERAAPAFGDSHPLERLAANRRRAAPTEISPAVRPERRSD